MLPLSVPNIVTRVRDAARIVRPCILIAPLVVQACADNSAATSPRMSPSIVAGDGGSIAQSISYSSMYSWRQGDPPTHMGSTTALWNRRACFLSRVSGQFTSTNESVRIERVGNDWYLNGASSTQGVGAWAHCMVVLEYSPQISSGVVNNPVSMNHGSRWMCFLTEVRGPLDENNQVVGVDFGPSGWDMANFATRNDGTRVAARCARPADDGDANVQANDHRQWWLGENPNALGTHNARVCVLTGLWGSFVVPDAFAQVTRAISSWWLYGGNLDPFAFEGGASAHCYS